MSPVSSPDARYKSDLQAPLKEIGCARRSDLYRASGEDSGDIREGYSEQAHQDVQSSVESSQ